MSGTQENNGESLESNASELFLNLLHPKKSPKKLEYQLDERQWIDIMNLAQHAHLLNHLIESVESAGLGNRAWRDLVSEYDDEIEAERLHLAIVENEVLSLAFWLKESRIPFMLLGAADWSRRFYPSRFRRPIKKIEVLVPQELFGISLRLVGKYGYRVRTGSVLSGIVGVSRGEDAPIVEIKKELFPNEPSPLNAMIWEDARTYDLPELPHGMSGLSSEQTLVYLVRSLMRMGFDYISNTPVWLFDIHHLLDSSPDFDWDIFVSRIQLANAVLPAWIFLKWTRLNFDSQIPEDVLSRLESMIHSWQKICLPLGRLDQDWPELSQERAKLSSAQSRLLLGEGLFKILFGAIEAKENWSVETPSRVTRTNASESERISKAG